MPAPVSLNTSGCQSGTFHQKATGFAAIIVIGLLHQLCSLVVHRLLENTLQTQPVFHSTMHMIAAGFLCIFRLCNFIAVEINVSASLVFEFDFRIPCKDNRRERRGTCIFLWRQDKKGGEEEEGEED